MTISYLTDERPKSHPKSKSSEKEENKAATDKSDKPAESARSQQQQQQQSAEASKIHSARNKEKPRNPDALSVTARWTTVRGPLTGRLTSRKVTFSQDSTLGLSTEPNGYASADDTALSGTSRDATVANGVEKGRNKKKKKKLSKNITDERLASSLDAGVPRDALNSRSNGSDDTNNRNASAIDLERSESPPPNGSVRLALDGSAVEEDSNGANLTVVPPLDLADMTNTPRSILRCVLPCLQ